MAKQKTVAKKKPKGKAEGKARAAPRAKPVEVVKSAAKKKVATTTEVATLLGVKMTKALKAAQISRLRKALPGYVGLIDDVAEQLEEDKTALNMKSPTPDDLLAVQTRVKDLTAREAVAEAVYTSVYHQRLQADDEAMNYLFTIGRRVTSRAEENPDLLARWKTLREFLANFRPGRGPATPDDPPDDGGNKGQG